MGDPTGKDASRKMLSDEEIGNNINGIKKAFDRYFARVRLCARTHVCVCVCPCEATKQHKFAGAETVGVRGQCFTRFLPHRD